MEPGECEFVRGELLAPETVSVVQVYAYLRNAEDGGARLERLGWEGCE